MASLEDRKKQQENKFVHEQELSFKIAARRNRLLADWAADKMGLASDEAKEFALSFVSEKAICKNEEEVVALLVEILQSSTNAISELEIQKNYDKAQKEAKAQLMNDN